MLAPVQGAWDMTFARGAWVEDWGVLLTSAIIYKLEGFPSRS